MGRLGRTPPRRPRALVAAALLLVGPVLPHVVSAAPAGAVCDFLVASPTVARDRTLFCGWSDGLVGGIRISTSTDLGRSWQTFSPVGLLPTEQGLLNDLIPSPDYATDRTLLVQTADALYTSTDRGAHVTLADPLGGEHSILPDLTPLRLAPTATVDLPAVSKILLAHARQSDRPEIVQPPLRTAAPGAPGPLDTFLVAPPGPGPYAGTILGVGREVYVPGVTGPSYRAVVYACDAALACPTVRGTMAYGHIVRDASMAADFATSGLAFFLTTGRGGGRLWVTRDGGRTIEPATGAQRVLDAVQRAGGSIIGARLASDPSRPGRQYLRVHQLGDRGGIPAEQMFVSNDAGRTWRRIGYARASTTSGPPGPAGWPGRSIGSGTGRAIEPMLVLGDGRIVVLGLDGDVNRTFCSVDGARTWRATCAR